jgi:DNA-binding NarL/FixJ family response regulator
VNNVAIQPIHVFLVDDYQTVLWGLAKLIQGEYPRMQLIGTASNLSEALSGLKLHHPDVVLLDDDLVEENILDFLPQLVEVGQHRILILATEQYSLEFTQQLMELGACGVLSKGVPADQLLSAIEHVHTEGHLLNQMSLD